MLLGFFFLPRIFYSRQGYTWRLIPPATTIISTKDTCINLLCSFPNFYDKLVLAICSTTQSALKYEDVVSSLLSEEMMRKSKNNRRTHDLFVRGHLKYRDTNKS
jgi:hypothetical protein